MPGAVSEAGYRFCADVLVGADGHRSIVRRAVAPDQPNARFAGDSLWIGVSHESALGHIPHWPRSLGIRSTRPHILLGYPCPPAMAP